MKKTLTFCFINLLTVSLSFSQVVINEIMYNPYYETTPGDPNTYDTNDDGEWIEFFNAGQSAVDMSNWAFTDGIEFTFPSGTSLEAGKYLIVARSTERFKADNGFDPDLIWTSGALSNSGEMLKVSDASGATVDEVEYDDRGDWGNNSSGTPPTAAGPSSDGLGPSLELKDFALDNALAASWGIVTGKKGTPGAVNGNFSGTPWTSTGGGGTGGGGTGGGGTTTGPVRTVAAGSWNGNNAPMINSLDDAPADTNYWQYFGWGVGAGYNGEGQDKLPGHYEVQGSAGPDTSYANISYVTDVKSEGTGSMKVDFAVQGSESWGGYAKIQHMHPDTAKGFYDFSKYDTISFQYHMPEPVKDTKNFSAVKIRFNLMDFKEVANPDYERDGSGAEHPLGEFFYGFTPGRLSYEQGTSDWVTIDIPLKNTNDGNYETSLTNGFNKTGWTGTGDEANGVLDTKYIKGFNIEFSGDWGQASPSGNSDRSTIATGTVYIDNITLKGRKTTPFVYFNGKASPADMGSPFGWGAGSASTLEVVQGAGTSSETNALKWTMGGDGWGATGAGWNINPYHDMSYEWMKDSVQFMYKTAKYSGNNIRLQYEAGSGKLVKEVDITADDKWHTVKIALKDFVYGDNTTSGFDTTQVKVFQFIAQGSGYEGETMLITDAWTGTPSFDFVSPAIAQNVDAIPGIGSYTNAVVWDDVVGEFGEVYDVYGSRDPFTGNIRHQNWDVIALGVSEGVQEAYHDLTVPLSDRPADWYYAVVVTDAAGNRSLPAVMTSPVSNIARGIPTISLTAPAGFKADGDISEWKSSGIIPLFMGVSTNSFGTPKVINTVDNDDDASVNVYLAADSGRLYVAADITDDDFNIEAGNWWEQDAFELFMGLYDQRGAKHATAQRGSEPDYKFVFLGDTAFVEFTSPSLGLSHRSYVDYANSGVNGSPNAVIEFSIHLDSLAAMNDDSVFVPTEGMRIAFEPTWHDRDAGSWQGNVAMSKLNNDNAYQTPSVWSHTYVGRKDGDILSTEEDIVASSFALERNYPNPFNPTTTIEYSLGLAGPTKLMIYDVLGRELVKLVDEFRPAGTHKVVWNASSMPSGVYFYRLESSNFVRTQKMILMK